MDKPQMIIGVSELLNTFADKESATKFLQEVGPNGIYSKKIHLRMDDSRNREVLDEEETEKFVEVINILREHGCDCSFKEGFSIEQAIEASRKINGMIKKINSARHKDGSELSPFEKYVYAFEMCTDFVYNAEGENENPLNSRQLIRVMTGDKIVCVGFASMLCHVLGGCGIDCTNFSINRPLKYRKEEGHRICLIYIEDPKYGIKGKFIADPTLACARGKDKHKEKYFQYMMMSLDDAKAFYEKSQFKFSNKNLPDLSKDSYSLKYWQEVGKKDVYLERFIVDYASDENTLIDSIEYQIQVNGELKRLEEEKKELKGLQGEKRERLAASIERQQKRLDWLQASIDKDIKELPERRAEHKRKYEELKGSGKIPAEYIRDLYIQFKKDVNKRNNEAKKFFDSAPWESGSNRKEEALMAVALSKGLTKGAAKALVKARAEEWGELKLVEEQNRLDSAQPNSNDVEKQ